MDAPNLTDKKFPGNPIRGLWYGGVPELIDKIIIRFADVIFITFKGFQVIWR